MAINNDDVMAAIAAIEAYQQAKNCETIPKMVEAITKVPDLWLSVGGTQFKAHVDRDGPLIRIEERPDPDA